MERFFMYGMPVWFFLLLFFFYGYGTVSPSMFVKISGLLSLLLLCVTFLIGPLSFFAPSIFNRFKDYRKYLGISGFLAAVVHVLLTFAFYYHWKFSVLYDFSNPKYLGIFLGLLGLVILFLLTITSTMYAIRLLGSTKWKILQTTGYLALLAVMEHFILMETTDGVFVIKRPLGRVIFVFGFAVILIRFIVFLLVEFRKKPKY